VEELGICEHSARVDLAVLGSSFHGYEIKGETDSLSRLNAQLEFYSQVFDRVTLVIAEKFLSPLHKKLPRWCGIVVATRSSSAEIELEERRDPIPHRHVMSSSLVQLLWRDEALDILIRLGKSLDLRRKSRAVLWQELVDSLTVEQLRAEIVCAMLKRNDWIPSGPRT
jgi:hypothetical protein